jgi:hypothetical protein
MGRFHAVLLASGVAACSLLTNLDDLNGTASDAATPDVFEGVTDGGMDAATDAVVDAITSPFCAQVDATFCDDFEEDGSFLPHWTGLYTAASGALTRTVLDSGCISVSVGAGDAASAADLNKAFLTSASKIHYAFDMQIAEYATASGATANTSQVYLPLVDGGGLLAGYVYLALSAASSRLVEQHHFADGGFSTQISAVFNSPAPGTWCHVDVVVDLVALTSSVSIDGADAGSISLPPVYQPGQPITYAGVNFETTNSDHFGMFLDNTVVWLE